jgi:uncharacterized membrane protein
MIVTKTVKNTRPSLKKVTIKRKNAFQTLFHYGFEVGILIKGIDGILEILGGFLMLYLNPARLDRVVIWLTQHELAMDPHDLLTNFIVKVSNNYTGSVQLFGVIYLIAHGLVKIILVSMLLRKRSWSYPLSMVFIFLFIIYQLYRYSYNHSIWMIMFTVFDISMILLIWSEYKRIRVTVQKNEM